MPPLLSQETGVPCSSQGCREAHGNSQRPSQASAQRQASEHGTHGLRGGAGHWLGGSLAGFGQVPGVCPAPCWTRGRGQEHVRESQSLPLRARPRHCWEGGRVHTRVGSGPTPASGMGSVGRGTDPGARAGASGGTDRRDRGRPSRARGEPCLPRQTESAWRLGVGPPRDRAGGGARVSGGRRGCRRARGSSQGPGGRGARREGLLCPVGCASRAPGRGRRLALWVPRSATRDEADHRTGPQVNIHTASGICLTQGRGRKRARGGHHALRGCLGRFHGRELKAALGICCPHRGPSSHFLGQLATFTE